MLEAIDGEGDTKLVSEQILGRLAKAKGQLRHGGDMSYESTAEPIKIGYLMDFRLPAGYPQEMREDFTRPFELVFNEGLKQGVIDRPIEIVYREVEGLPKGTVKAVIDAYGELVDEGCLVVFGPHITDNCVPTREAIEERFRVPAIAVTGTDDWLGEWTFSFPQGSMTDEPIFWSDLLAKGGHSEVGVLVEQSLVGESYLKNFRKACASKGIRIVAEASIAQTAQDINDAVRTLYESKAQAVVHCGFGFGIVFINPALQALSWGPPKFTSTAFQNAWINPVMWNAFLGWTGIDQYDENNLVGQRYLDQYEAAYGRRPQYCVPVVNRDVAATLLRAFSDAHPLSPRGVKEALERVKMLPAAAGAPGTRVSLGKWTRRAWMGAGYLVARRLDPDGVNSHLVDRFGEE
jgi:branched-chain amino acid transport system substrate-binding protein